jgi:hypothetical protein
MLPKLDDDYDDDEVLASKRFWIIINLLTYNHLKKKKDLS